MSRSMTGWANRPVFPLHVGVAPKADECKKLERRRYIARPAVSEKRLSLTPDGNVRYQLYILPRPSAYRTEQALCNHEIGIFYEAENSR